MVSECAQGGGGNPQIRLSAPGYDDVALRTRPTSPTPSQAKPDGFESVRRSLEEQQISARATALILHSWRGGMKKQYKFTSKSGPSFVVKGKLVTFCRSRFRFFGGNV